MLIILEAWTREVKRVSLAVELPNRMYHRRTKEPLDEGCCFKSLGNISPKDDSVSFPGNAYTETTRFAFPIYVYCVLL